MEISPAVLEAAEVWLRNPFEVDPQRAAQTRSALLHADGPHVVAALVRQGKPVLARHVVLAVAHAQAWDDPRDPKPVLHEKTWGAALKGLGISRGDCVRVVMASVRCVAALEAMKGTSSAMQALRRQVWAACFGASLENVVLLERVIRDHDVLIVGETGSGKEGIAHALLEGIAGPEDGSPAPRATVNAAALPETLVEGELFGHTRGAFTGATHNRIGRIRSANGGGFFLDEVGDLPLSTQAKLLRLIEEDEVMPLGSDTVHQVDVRFIAATHRDLPDMVGKQQFRRDLYERLAGCVIRVPPLRERPEDIATIGMQLVRMYLPEDTSGLARRIEKWLHSPEALRNAWHGNVRELNNALRNLMLGLPAPGPSGEEPVAAPSTDTLPPSIQTCTATMDQVTDWYMQRVLNQSEHNHAKAARTLGVDRTTLRRRSRAWKVPALG